MKKLYFIISIFIILITITSCAGTSDWDFDLPNDFQVWHINSKNIKIVYTGAENIDVEVPSFIKEFAIEKEYVFTRNVDNIESNNILDEKFYILNTKNKVLYGPYKTVEELESLSENMGIEFPDYWYRSSPNPNFYVPEYSSMS